MRKKLVVIGAGMASGRMLEQLFETAPDAYDVTLFNAEPRGNYNRLMLSPVQDEPVTTQSFTLDAGVRNLVLRHDTNLDNNWLGLNMTLVEKATGKAWLAQTEVAYWHGNDGGESWSEGDRERELVLRDLPAGT